MLLGGTLLLRKDRMSMGVILVVGEESTILTIVFTAVLTGITALITPSMLAGGLTTIDTLHSAKLLGWAPPGAFAVSG